LAAKAGAAAARIAAIPRAMLASFILYSYKAFRITGW